MDELVVIYKRHHHPYITFDQNLWFRRYDEMTTKEIFQYIFNSAAVYCSVCVVCIETKFIRHYLRNKFVLNYWMYFHWLWTRRLGELQSSIIEALFLNAFYLLYSCSNVWLTPLLLKILNLKILDFFRTLYEQNFHSFHSLYYFTRKEYFWQGHQGVFLSDVMSESSINMASS